MTTPNQSLLPTLTAEHRRAAAGQFERANQVVATGNYDYGIRLLLSCCELDPANLIYRQALRRTEKVKYRNNLRGHWLAWLTTLGGKAKVKTTLRRADYLKVLEQGERVLTRNPWDVGTQLAMSEAADHLGLLDLAIWILEQARQKAAKDVFLNRTLARLYEKRGNFTQAMALWELVRKVKVGDGEANRKIKDLAASDTIARGSYGEIAGIGDAGEKAKSGSGEKKSGSRSHPVLRPQAPPTPQEDNHELSPLQQRLARDAGPIRHRIRESPTFPSNYLQLARLYRQHGELVQAREALTEGLAATGNAFELSAELADLEIEPFRQDLHLTEEKLKALPEDPELRKLRQRLRKEINSRELQLYRMKADRFPTDMHHRLEVGVRLLRAGEYDEAIKELQSARNDLKVRWNALLHLGHCFKARNNWRLAQRNFEESLQSLPPNEKSSRKELLFLLAQGSAEHGDLPKAIDYGNELANEDYTFRDIGRLLDEWQSRLQQEGVKG
jgi:tetratricopeptide (TPR) repeat protein